MEGFQVLKEAGSGKDELPMVLPFPYCPMFCECSVKENSDRIGKILVAKNSILDMADFLVPSTTFDNISLQFI